MVDLGGRSREVDAVRERARVAGAVDALVVDAKTEYADRYVVGAVQANAGGPGRPLVPALRLPIIADHLTRTARQLGAVAVAHLTSAPDEVALTTTVAGYDPDLRVLTVPTRVVPVGGTEHDVWGRLVAEPDPEDPWVAVDAAGWARTADPAAQPDPEPDEVTAVQSSAKSRVLVLAVVLLEHVVERLGAEDRRHAAAFSSARRCGVRCVVRR